MGFSFNFQWLRLPQLTKEHDSRSKVIINEQAVLNIRAKIEYEAQE